MSTTTNNITTPAGTYGMATMWGSVTVAVAARWSDASAPVMIWDGGWSDSPRQVADYGHSPSRALRAALEECAIAEGLDADQAEALIEQAMDEAVDIAASSDEL